MSRGSTPLVPDRQAVPAHQSEHRGAGGKRLGHAPRPPAPGVAPAAVENLSAPARKDQLSHAGLPPDAQRSISPRTMSREPITAITSATMRPTIMGSMDCQIDEARRPDPEAPGLLRAVRDQVVPQFALGGLHAHVHVALGRLEPAAHQLEVADQGLDVLVHVASAAEACSGGRRASPAPRASGRGPAPRSGAPGASPPSGPGSARTRRPRSPSGPRSRTSRTRSRAGPCAGPTARPRPGAPDP